MTLLLAPEGFVIGVAVCHLNRGNGEFLLAAYRQLKANFSQYQLVLQSVCAGVRSPMTTSQASLTDALTAKSKHVWFYAGMGCLAIAFTIAGFAPGLIDTQARLAPLTPVLAIHGAVFFAWLLLFLAQTMLIQAGKIAVHRRLGMSSAILAAAMVVLGYWITIAMARRGYDLSGDLAARSDPAAAIAFPLLDIAMFASLYVAACLFRRQPAVHKRLMLLAVVAGLMPASVTHLLGHFSFFQDKLFLTPVLVGAFLAASAAYDRIALHRIHPVSLWVPLFVFALENVYFAVVIPSRAWHAFAAKLMR